MIRIADFGPDASGRERAEHVREQVNFAAAHVTFDCAGVESMSASFADELFGKLSEVDERPQMSVTNVPEHVRDVIRFALKQRQR